MSEGDSDTAKLVAAILTHAVVSEGSEGDRPARLQAALEVYHALLVELGRR